MSRIIKIWLFKLHAWLNKLLVKHVDINGSNTILKVVTKKIGITWIDMINHVEVSNKFFIAYKLIEVKLTYYNDVNQNIGYLHFKEPVTIGRYSKKIVQMPAKMSNITALFNMVRLIVSNDIKTRTVGTTTIQIMGIKFELPIDDIMIIDKNMLVLEEEEDRNKRLEDRAKKEAEFALLKVEREEKRKIRLSEIFEKRAENNEKLMGKINAQKEKMAFKKAARQRLNRMKANKLQGKKEVPIPIQPQEIEKPQENPTAQDNSLLNQ